MRKLAVLLVCLLSFSCGNRQDVKVDGESETSNVKRELVLDLYQNVRVIEIDSCEYITITGTTASGVAIIHKNNCKFCAKR